MGCGGSKEAANEPIPLEPARTATARSRTSNRPPTNQTRPASKRPPSSQRSSSSKRPSSSSTKPSTSSRRPSSSQRLSSSSRRTGSAQGGRTRPKSSYRGQPTIYEDHTPEDNDITQGIIVLCTLIDQHAERFYAAQYSSYVRRTIGEALVNYIRAGGGNVSAILSDVTGKLGSYASNPADNRREEHIERMCTSADRIQRMVQRHPSDWSFGRFDQGVWFPSVYQDGAVVKDPDCD